MRESVVGLTPEILRRLLGWAPEWVVCVLFEAAHVGFDRADIHFRVGC